jgi:hypothetical protein
LSFRQDRLQTFALLAGPPAPHLLLVFHHRHDVAASDEACGVLGLHFCHFHHVGGAPFHVRTSDGVELIHLIFGQLQTLPQPHDRLDAAILPGFLSTFHTSRLRAAPTLLGRETCCPAGKQRQEQGPKDQESTRRHLHRMLLRLIARSGEQALLVLL